MPHTKKETLSERPIRQPIRNGTSVQRLYGGYLPKDGVFTINGLEDFRESNTAISSQSRKRSSAEPPSCEMINRIYDTLKRRQWPFVIKIVQIADYLRIQS